MAAEAAAVRAQAEAAAARAQAEAAARAQAEAEATAARALAAHKELATAQRSEDVRAVRQNLSASEASGRQESGSLDTVPQSTVDNARRQQLEMTRDRGVEVTLAVDGGRSTDTGDSARVRALQAADAEVDAAVARAQTMRAQFAQAQRAGEMREAEQSLSTGATGGPQGGRDLIAAVQQAVEQTLQRAMGGQGETSDARVPGEGHGSPSRGVSPSSLYFNAASDAPVGDRNSFRAHDISPPPLYSGAFRSRGISPPPLYSGASSSAPAGERSTFRSATNWSETSTEGSALVAAAQTQAFAATTALDQKTGTPDVAKSHKDANYTHSHYILRRALLLGKHSSNIAPDQVFSDIYQDILCSLFRNHFQNNITYKLGYKITTCMVVFTARVDFVSLILHVEQFKRVPSEDLVSGPITLDAPLHFEKLSKDGITDAEVYHSCCLRLAQWLTLVYYEELGQSFASFVTEAFALWEENPSIKLVHFKDIVVEGGRVMQQACIDQLAYVNAQFRQRGQPTLGANQHSLKYIKDLATIPVKATGEPTLQKPYARLLPGHPEGVLSMYMMEHKDKLRRAGLAAQVERLEAGATTKKSSGPSQYAKGPAPAAPSILPTEDPITRSEVARSRRAMPVNPESALVLCHLFAAHDGCPRTRCSFDHTLPLEPLSASAKLGLLPRGGSRVAGEQRVVPEDVPAASAALRSHSKRDGRASLQQRSSFWWQVRASCSAGPAVGGSAPFTCGSRRQWRRQAWQRSSLW